MTAEPQHPAPGGAPFTMVVERGKVMEFARATKSSHPAYLAEEGALTPVTFLAAARWWQGPESAAPVSMPSFERLLHGSQEFVFHGEPPRAGSVLIGRSLVARTYTKAGRRGGTMRFTDLLTEFRDGSGHLVVEMWSTMIETGRAPERAPA